MDSENSTFNTSKVIGNEVVKAEDFEFGFESLVTNLSKFAQMIFECNQDFVIGGKVTVDSGTNIKVAPIFGVCASTGIPFGMTDTSNLISIEQNEAHSRIDILEAKGEWIDYDEQQRAFNDLDNNVITYRDIETKQRLKVTYKVKKGEDDSVTAPATDEGYVKIAEIIYSAGTTDLFNSDIKNITADVSGLENENWTNEKTKTYNIGYISDVNAKFREEHELDGSHKEGIIHAAQLDAGVADTQVNATKLPLVSSGNVGSDSYSSADNIDAAFVKFATQISNLYNEYLKYGKFNFKGEVAISFVADDENKLTKPLILGSAGDDTAYVKIGTKSIFTITADGKIRMPSDYSASDTNDLVTKGVTDTIAANLQTQKERIDGLISTSDPTTYANNTMARYDYVYNEVHCATTRFIDLLNESIIDNVSLQSGYLVLVKDQLDEKENGLYEKTSNGLVRHSSYDTFDKIKHKFYVIQNGSANKNKIFYSPTENYSGDLGSEKIIFSEYKKLKTQQYDDKSITSDKLAANLVLQGNTVGNFTGNFTGNVIGNVVGEVSGLTRIIDDETTSNERCWSSDKINTLLRLLNPVGEIKSGYFTEAPYGWFMCDGQTSYSRTEYPDLWNVLKNIPECKGDGSLTFTTPDLRECNLVGAGTSSRSDIEQHDAITLGTFRNDAMQGHKHTDSGHNHYFYNSTGSGNITYHQSDKTAGGNDSIGTNTIGVSTGYASLGLPTKYSDDYGTPRVGTTTHGKEVGVNYIIKW